MYDFTSMILPCWCGALRSSILSQRYVLQIHQASWVCDVIYSEYMRCHHYWSRGWFYFVRYMVLCFVEVVSEGMRWVGGVVYRIFIRSACASFSTYYCLKCTISRPWFLPCRCGALRSPILRQRYRRWICMVGGLLCFFFPRFNIGRSTNTQYS